MTRRAWLLAGGAAGLVALPLILFCHRAGDYALYLGNHCPPGQGAYIMMRPAGHLAFVLVFLQLVLGLHGPRLARWAGLPPLLSLHKALGLATLSFALLHALLFLLGRAWRLGIPLGTSAREVFFPDPTFNYWSYYFFFGALAFWTLLASVLAALVGPRLSPKGWRWVHALAWPALFLGWHHAMHTGNEVRDQFLGVVYTTMAAVAAGMLLVRLAGARGSPGRPGETPVS